MDFETLNTIINYINKHNTANLKLVLSTPSDYVSAIHSQNLTWPVKYSDGVPYGDQPDDYWSGFFSSRPWIKKQVRDTSSALSAMSKLYASKVINQNTTDEEVDQMVRAKQEIMQQLGVSLHHDAITGTARDYVTKDYSVRLAKAIKEGEKMYLRELESVLAAETGINLHETLQKCGAMNETVKQCP